jgi:hypothetical protein
MACNVCLHFSMELQETRRKNKKNRENEKELHTSGHRGFQSVEDDMVSTCDALYYFLNDKF